MRKLEAALRDRAARTWRFRRVCYRVGSYFKGCDNCGEKVLVELGSGREVVRYLSGYQVFRSYQPKAVGWTYWCWTCGAKDRRCWSGAADVGTDAIVGARDAVKNVKLEIRRDRARAAREAERSAKVARISEMEARLVELLRQLEEGRKK